MDPLHLREVVVGDSFKYCTLSPARGSGQGKDVSPFVSTCC